MIQIDIDMEIETILYGIDKKSEKVEFGKNSL